MDLLVLQLTYMDYFQMERGQGHLYMPMEQSLESLVYADDARWNLKDLRHHHDGSALPQDLKFLNLPQTLAGLKSTQVHHAHLAMAELLDAPQG